ncbi:PI-PLC domain-containing protein [Arundinibacter roseus]|uniref:Altered inheritance of mitochondria protein 6 n=1 Tax=Arundinibacter roseus TaxID=2070510 RepID=A0A4R4K8H5_9BACT|nr:alkaline phosphatase [Arundinibacter roseus]TDB63723.1 alkaline phosphatase [Arundinibacter roseus]
MRQSFYLYSKVFSVLIPVLLLVALVAQAQPSDYSMAQAHSHNDYEQARPFHAAYELGFGSVEADIFLKNGELYVAHNWEDIQSDRTFRALYLNPLLEKIRANNGWPYPGKRPIQILIDLKNTGQATLKVLEQQLHPHRKQLRHVRFVISGDMPAPDKLPEQYKLFTFDGRKNLTYSPKASARVVLVSSSLMDFGGFWDGQEPMKPTMKEKVRQFVATQHVANKLVRLWATPNTELSYQTLKELGVDYLGTDDLPGLATFLQPTK